VSERLGGAELPAGVKPQHKVSSAKKCTAMSFFPESKSSLVRLEGTTCPDSESGSSLSPTVEEVSSPLTFQ